jgi:hypothetical protein
MENNVIQKQAGLVLCWSYVPENIAQIERKFPI